jgi:hypothetical protein
LLLPMKSDPTVKLRNFNIVDQMQFNWAMDKVVL